MRRSVLITGSATGLGSAIAYRLAEQGHRIILNYRTSAEACLQLQNKIQATHTECHIVQADVSYFEEAERLIRESIERFGTIDILIHCAGPFLYQRQRATDMDISDWKYMIDSNLSSAFYLSKLVIPYMRKQGFGRIITFGFDGAEQARGWRYRSAYAAAKVGLVSFTRTLALEERHNGITVNMVCPGDIRGKWKETFLDEYLQTHDRIGRISMADDITRTVQFLIDEHADYVTGNVIQLNGGIDTVILTDEITKNDVLDPVQFSPGEEVYVYPWNSRGLVEQVSRQKNDLTLYTVRTLDRNKTGRFTYFHLEKVNPK
ncbi:3-ketoacyl-ACP reductase [Collibacillus ludicampi]|uniref:3-ketoacyl-ACP reductase n=1 Tax=Collibacillus ludicampi TaxID=2771369 RepID=A0AAV4LIJ5_9BACL|nr:SDR family oxidoreductase [Collibacillus ludicampi]GIM47566.1 3-ketoacyl-ACP reductase [Collibacillus ludicampi]